MPSLSQPPTPKPESRAVESGPPSPRPPSSIRELARSIPLLLLLAASAWALWFHARMPFLEVSDADYIHVAQVLQQQGEATDAVLLFPWWTERARLFLPEKIPVVGHIHSDGEDLTDHPRIWLLAQNDLPKSDPQSFHRAFDAGRTPLGSERHFGHLTLSLFRNDRYRPKLFSAAASIADAHVFLEDGKGQRSDCPWNGRAHVCPGGAHLRAAQEWHEVNQIPRHCLYLHPPGGSGRMVVEFSQVPAGSSVSLEGGLIWEHAAARPPEVGDAEVSAWAGGQKLLGFVARAGVETFYREWAPSPSAPFSVQLVVSAQNPARREMCIDFFSRGNKP